MMCSSRTAHEEGSRVIGARGIDQRGYRDARLSPLGRAGRADRFPRCGLGARRARARAPTGRARRVSAHASPRFDAGTHERRGAPLPAEAPDRRRVPEERRRPFPRLGAAAPRASPWCSGPAATKETPPWRAETNGYFSGCARRGGRGHPLPLPARRRRDLYADPASRFQPEGPRPVAGRRSGGVPLDRRRLGRRAAARAGHLRDARRHVHAGRHLGRRRAQRAAATWPTSASRASR